MGCYMIGKKTILSVLAILIIGFNCYSQKETIEEVRQAIKIGSSKEFAKYFNGTIDVTLDNSIQTYSKTQAEYVFKDFFKNNPPTSFTIVHQGASTGGLPYAIGQYLSKGMTYRVWMRIKASGGSYLIHEISFIKE